jgi:non-heme chloroperoxidase
MQTNQLYKNLTAVILLLISFLFLKAQNQPVYQTKFVTGSTDNKLEVLDWGGTGEPILFLSGLGNSAHVFVDFAPKFTDKFHVYAMTRRGFGASELTTAGYSIDTLAKDILAVENALHLDKVILIGHSIAGDEISKFASSYPNRVEKIVYLDAAHDRTNLMALYATMPSFPNPTTTDSASIPNFKRFVARVYGVSFPDDELKNTQVFAKDGKYEKGVTPDFVQGLVIKGLQHPNYQGIECPALAIYAIPSSVAQLFPFYKTLDAENKKRADTTFASSVSFTKEQEALFKKAVKIKTVKEIDGAHHYVFISNPAETEKFIRSFLK